MCWILMLLDVALGVRGHEVKNSQKTCLIDWAYDNIVPHLVNQGSKLTFTTLTQQTRDVD